MKIGTYAKRVERLVHDNSPVILTALAVTGTITTAIFAGRASYKAAQILAEERQQIQDMTGEELTDHAADRARRNLPVDGLSKKEIFDRVWLLYMPAIGAATFTCAAIVGANRIGTRRAAAVAAAYSLSEKALGEYKDKVVEKFGENKATAVRDEIAQDRVNANPPKEGQIIITGNGEVLCHEAYTDRYFYSNVEAIKKAENQINRQILDDDHATVSDFYDRLGIEHTSISDEFGWNHASTRGMEILISSVVSPDGQPAVSFDYGPSPVLRPWQFS